jgi:hypothetical protein
VEAVIAVAVGLPLGVVATAWIGLDGWGSYRDAGHLGRLLSEAWVTMLVLAIGTVVLGAVVGRHGWLAGLAAWPVIALGLPSLLGASGLAAATAASLIAAGSAGVAALGGLAGVSLRARALLTTAGVLGAAVIAIAALHVVGGWLTAAPAA